MFLSISLFQTQLVSDGILGLIHKGRCLSLILGCHTWLPFALWSGVGFPPPENEYMLNTKYSILTLCLFNLIWVLKSVLQCVSSTSFTQMLTQFIYILHTVHSFSSITWIWAYPGPNRGSVAFPRTSGRAGDREWQTGLPFYIHHYKKEQKDWLRVSSWTFSADT